ncbi:GNAT family N-acetyltransferase [Candidatus Micrarchaeota archaeon]|nr:GNAT family N-acetyltransferase [Candidatus Micrarchaeota archaeon]
MINIRKAVKKDIPEIILIEKEEDDENIFLNKTELNDALQDHLTICLVAENRKKIIGFVVSALSPPKKSEGAIYITIVKKEERKKGIGKMLVSQALQEMKSLGVKYSEALVENNDILSFYKKCGFKNINKSWKEMKCDL